MAMKTKIIASWSLVIIGVLASLYIYDRLLIIFLVAAVALRSELKDKNHPVNLAFKQTSIWTIFCAVYICFIAIVALYFRDEIYKGHFHVVTSVLVIFWPFLITLLFSDIKEYDK